MRSPRKNAICVYHWFHCQNSFQILSLFVLYFLVRTEYKGLIAHFSIFSGVYFSTVFQIFINQAKSILHPALIFLWPTFYRSYLYQSNPQKILELSNMQNLFDNNSSEKILAQATDYIWLEKPFLAKYSLNSLRTTLSFL